jgi:protein-tyrosine kinase
MERIKQALEKARQDRMRAGTPTVFATGGRTVVPISDIQYTQTATVPITDGVLRENRVISSLTPEAFGEAYKMLSTQVLQRFGEEHWNALAITSPGDSEGKTLTAINLGISIAREVNYTVLLVDADLRHPNVHRILGIESARGLSDYLVHDVPLGELLINPAGVPRFVVLPGGAPLQNSSEMLNSPKMVRLTEELKSRYRSRIVLFDLPPVLTAADTLAFSPYVDAALLVVEDGKTLADDVANAADLLKNTQLIGTVLNKSPIRTEDAGTSGSIAGRIERWLLALSGRGWVRAAGAKLRALGGRLTRKTSQ